MAKEKWSKGKQAGCVVSNTRAKMSIPDGRSHNDVDYYGGYLVAESIPKEEYINLISAAPILLEALEALFSNEHLDLGDLVYNVRDREMKGWDGPSVTQWSNAVTAARKAIREAYGESKQESEAQDG